MDSDKRKNERKELSEEVVLEFSSGTFETRISDISLGGCYVDAIASVSEGEAISLTIAISQERSERFYGEVAYLLPGSGFGIRFTNLTDENTDFLRQILS